VGVDEVGMMKHNREIQHIHIYSDSNHTYQFRDRLEGSYLYM